MAHQFEVTQAEKSFLKVRHPVEGLTFTFHVVEGHGGRRTAWRCPQAKKGLSQAKQLTTLAMPAHSRKPRHAGAR